MCAPLDRRRVQQQVRLGRDGDDVLADPPHEVRERESTFGRRVRYLLVVLEDEDQNTSGTDCGPLDQGEHRRHVDRRVKRRGNVFTVRWVLGSDAVMPKSNPRQRKVAVTVRPSNGG